MTEDEATKAMMVTAQALLDRSKTDPAVAEMLLADPNSLISRLIDAPLPHGAVFAATRDENGEIDLSLDMNADGAAAAEPEAAEQPEERKGGFVVDSLGMTGKLD